MKNALVISPSTSVADAIEKALPNRSEIKGAESLSTALGMHQRFPFDIVFVDLESPEIASNTLSLEDVVERFSDYHPTVQVIVVSPKPLLNKAFRNARTCAAGLITHPIEAGEVRQVFENGCEAAIKSLELDYLRDHFWKTEWIELIYSRNPAMKAVYESIRSVAPTVATVMLLGETGTGKGLMARLVHRHSNRAEAPFIAVHCGAIPDTLIESELFGHEKGAFTGADRRKIGKFEVANRGTIFLDEIGTLSAAAQIKLLQVLQDGTYSRLGGTGLMTTNARIIAATNADLKQGVEQGTFRSDLYYRLHIFPVTIPPLRERLEDIPHLAQVFLSRLNQKYGKSIHRLHPAVKAGFSEYDWPGNIRELENILERAYILAEEGEINTHLVPSDLVKLTRPVDSGVDPGDLPLAEARQIAIHAFEHTYLNNLMEQCNGKIGLAAKRARVTTRQINRLMVRHGIRKTSFR